MLACETAHLFSQRLRQSLRKHQHPVLAAFALAHDQCLLREVNVLHAQLQGLADPHAGAVQQPCQQGMLSLHPRQDAHHLVSTQHDWQAPTNTWMLQLRHPWQAHLQHLAVQEYQRRQGLLVSGRGQLSLVGKPGQKSLDLGRTKIPRVAARESG
jgi:hypothetical protein